MCRFIGLGVEYANRVMGEDPDRRKGGNAKDAIGPDSDADFVFLDENDAVVRTVAQGRMIYQRKA